MVEFSTVLQYVLLKVVILLETYLFDNYNNVSYYQLKEKWFRFAYE